MVMFGILFVMLGIPTLVIVDEERKLVTTQGRAAVSNDADGKEFPWYPKPLNKLTGATAGQINDSPSLILFTSKKTPLDICVCMQVLMSWLTSSMQLHKLA